MSNVTIDFWDIAANAIWVGFVYAGGWASGITRERRNRNNRLRALLQLRAGLDEGRERLTEAQRELELAADSAIERLEVTAGRAAEAQVVRFLASVTPEEAAAAKARFLAVQPKRDA